MVIIQGIVMGKISVITWKTIVPYQLERMMI